MFARAPATVALVAGVAFTAVVACPARQATAGEPSPSDKETARALFKEGEQKRKAGDLKGALEAFRAAHAIMNVPTTGLELGKTQAQLGQIVEARDTLLSVVRIPVVAGEPDKYPQAREEAKKLADQLEPKLASLKIVLTHAPSGVTPKVTIDGVEIHSATIGVVRKHNPGKHDVVVVVGKVEKSESVELTEGETKEITFDLAPAEGPEKPPEDPHDKPPEPVVPAPPPKPSYTLAYVGYGAAAVFLVGGVVTGLFAFSKAQEAKDGCVDGKCPPATHDAIDASKTFGTVSTISFGLALAGGVVGTIGLFTAKPSATPSEKDAARGLRLGPLEAVRLGIGPGSIALHARF